MRRHMRCICPIQVWHALSILVKIMISTRRTSRRLSLIHICIWIGTEDNGVNVLDPRTGKVHQIHDNVPGRLITLSVKHYENHIYVGLFKQGMNDISIPGEHLKYISDKELNIEEGSVYSFLKDSKGLSLIHIF